MRKCPNCEHEQDESAVICTYCGALLTSAEDEYTTTRSLDNDEEADDGVQRWGSVQFAERMNLVISVRGEDARFTYDANSIDELVIGRYDPDTSESPAVDLRNYGGTEKGVSRRHASIIRRDGALRIVDRGSPNGTYLNGQRLIAEQPRILRDGDDVRLGHLVLQIHFLRAPSSETTER